VVGRVVLTQPRALGAGSGMGRGFPSNTHATLHREGRAHVIQEPEVRRLLHSWLRRPRGPYHSGMYMNMYQCVRSVTRPTSTSRAPRYGRSMPVSTLPRYKLLFVPSKTTPMRPCALCEFIISTIFGSSSNRYSDWCGWMLCFALNSIAGRML
jgi:hypothetical protein